MTTTKTIFFFSFLLLGLNSCKDEKHTKSDYAQTIENYSELLDHAEQNNSEALSKKLDEMNADENFHLQKIQQRHGEVALLQNGKQLLEEKKFHEARELISEHIKKFGISESLEDTRKTIIALENFQKTKQQVHTGTLSHKELLIAEKEMLKAFPKNTGVKTYKMKQWFNTQKRSLVQKANENIARLRMITLLQIDQLNARLQLESKSGAEIYYHQLSRGKTIAQKEKQLANSIITLTTDSKTNPASISDLVLQLYSKAPKQSIAQTSIELSEINEICSLDQSIKNRILRTSLKSHGITPKDLDGPPLLNPPTLMQLILKSEQQD